MNTISPHITEFGITDQEVETPAAHRHYRSRNLVKKNSSAIQLTSIRNSHILDDQFNESIQLGLNTAIRNTVPAFIALAGMLLLALAYFKLPAFQNAYNQIAVLKIKMGVLFPFLGMGLGVAIFSEIIKVSKSPTKRWTRANSTNFICLFLMFGIIATAKDPIFYLLAHLYGDNATLGTLIKKVFFDQFAWTLLLVCPAQSLLYSWKAHGYSMKSLYEECPNFTEFFALKMVPALIQNWYFWAPASVIIYCFPTNLQLATSIIATVLWIGLRSAYSPSRTQTS
jgi:hypothetical protein